MNILFLVMFAAGVTELILGIKALKSPRKRKPGLLMIFLGVCMLCCVLVFIFFEKVKPTDYERHIVYFGGAYMAGVMSGIFLSMLLLGHVRLLLGSGEFGFSKSQRPAGNDSGHHCVACGAPINNRAEICPKCGWTQPV